MSDEYHTLMIYTGSVETISVGCLMFHHDHGFETPKEMIENFILCVYLAQFHLLVDEGKIDRKISDNIKTEKDFWAFIEKDSIVYNSLMDDFHKWPTKMANEFDIWDYLEYNGWDPWRKPQHAKSGKFVEIEGFGFLLESFGNSKNNFNKINWERIEENFIIGSYNIEKNS